MVIFVVEPIDLILNWIKMHVVLEHVKYLDT